MLGTVAAKKVVTDWFGLVGRTLKRLVAPAANTVTVAGLAHDITRPRSDLIAENALLRQQLLVLSRTSKRPAIRDGDRLVMVVLASLIRAWRDALLLVQPETLMRWHGNMFRVIWRRKSRTRGQQPNQLRPETIAVIVTMARNRVTSPRGCRW